VNIKHLDTLVEPDERAKLITKVYSDFREGLVMPTILETEPMLLYKSTEALSFYKTHSSVIIKALMSDGNIITYDIDLYKEACRDKQKIIFEAKALLFNCNYVRPQPWEVN
jgi:hypothetical protein